MENRQLKKDEIHAGFPVNSESDVVLASIKIAELLEADEVNLNAVLEKYNQDPKNNNIMLFGKDGKRIWFGFISNSVVTKM